MIMKREIRLVQDNKLTLSRYEFTPIEKRCLYYVIKEVRRLYVNKDIEGLVAVRSIANTDMEGVVLAGADSEGIYTAIMLSFVKKEGVHALQVVTMSPKFKPDQQLSFGITLSNGEKMLLECNVSRRS